LILYVGQDNNGTSLRAVENTFFLTLSYSYYTFMSITGSIHFISGVGTDQTKVECFISSNQKSNKEYKANIIYDWQLLRRVEADGPQPISPYTINTQKNSNFYIRMYENTREFICIMPSGGYIKRIY
jgi:hypothetical protein